MSNSQILSNILYPIEYSFDYSEVPAGYPTFSIAYLIYPTSKGIQLLGCFPREYFVLLGLRVRFELLKQVIPPCPNMYPLLWYEYEYQHGIQNPNTVLLLLQICPEM